MKKNIKFILTFSVLLFGRLHSQTWTRVLLSPMEPTLVGMVFFQDTGIIIAGGGLIIKSNDYFNTFVIDSTYDTADLWGLSFPTRSTGYINRVGLGTPGMLKTNDGGNTWAPLPNIITALPLETPNILEFVSIDTAYSGSGFSSSSALFATYNGGITWQVTDTNSANPLWGQILRIKVLHDSIIYMLIIAYQTPGSPLNNTCIERSSNYGRTWTQISSIFSYPAGCGDFYFLDDTTIILSLTGENLTGEILKSVNGGLSFDTVLLADGYYLYPTQAIAFSGRDTGYVAFAKSVYKTYDAGNTWTSANFSFAPEDSFNNILLLTLACSQNVVVGCANGDIYKTENGGCGVTGVEEVPDDILLNVYPNPVSVGSWQLAVGNDMLGGEMEILDADGRLVYRAEIKNLHTEIDAPFAGGVYFLRITSGSGVVVRKLVRL